ncbi:hypothetical protein [Comamonas thiooxydans]|nr:hypothetical protein [Comamonas thiooxydans]
MHHRIHGFDGLARNEAAKAQEVLYWLQEQQLQMKGKITMHKTENG